MGSVLAIGLILGAELCERRFKWVESLRLSRTESADIQYHSRFELPNSLVKTPTFEPQPKIPNTTRRIGNFVLGKLPEWPLALDFAGEMKSVVIGTGEVVAKVRVVTDEFGRRRAWEKGAQTHAAIKLIARVFDLLQAA